MTKAEEWKSISGFEGYYKVSNLGNVMGVERVVNGGSGPRVWKAKVLSKCIGTHGYEVVNLRREGVGKTYCVHVLVMEAFGDSRPVDCEVRHKNGERTNNKYENLEWGTRLENIRDKEKHGTKLKGEAVPNSILSSDDVVKIKIALLAKESQASLAKKYGVAIETIHSIKTQKSWRHIHV